MTVDEAQRIRLTYGQQGVRLGLVTILSFLCLSHDRLTHS